jgi:hypothetical protein
MIRFLSFLREFNFADLHPQTGQWTSIPTSVLKHAQHEPHVNIDDELYDLLAKSYAYIDGHVDFKQPSDLPANHTIWYAMDIDGNKTPDVLKFGKQTAHGIKWTGGASDGSPAAKQKYVDTTVTALKTPGNYAEMSDAIMHIMITRYHIPCVSSEAEVEQIIGKDVRWIGAHPDGKYPGYNGFYERTLGGAKHLKILLGLPS